MLDIDQYVNNILEPSLMAVELHTLEAESLLLGTMAVESNFGTYIKQIKGPALGFYGQEPNDYDDIRYNYLDNRDALSCKLLTFLDYRSFPTYKSLLHDLRLQVIMSRLHYRRIPDELPAFNDIEGQAKYWKQHYNTPKGKGSVEKFMADYKRCLIDRGYNVGAKF
jgi:hypothetical protein